jgi:hypothetical protein
MSFFYTHQQQQQQHYPVRVSRPGYPQPLSLGMAQLIDASRPNSVSYRMERPQMHFGYGSSYCTGSHCPSYPSNSGREIAGSSSVRPSTKSNSVARASGI